MEIGTPEGGEIVDVPNALVARLRIKLKCEKCHAEETISGMVLMKGETSVMQVTVGPHLGRYYFMWCRKCGYPLLKEVKHYVGKPKGK